MADGEKRIPKKGANAGKLLTRMKALRTKDVDWRHGKAFSLVFHQSDEHSQLLKDAYDLFFEGNGLNPMAFESLRTFEYEVLRMTAGMLNGGGEAVGTMTSGGTESILLAVKTYRELARARRPKVRRPQIVVPQSVHVAFDKAGKYFDVDVQHVPLEEDGGVDVAAMRRAITNDTIALVGSAPNYPNGAIDPIEALSDLALEHELPLHVDACIGGFFLPWAERLGRGIPPFDFRLPGVTSMSADLHKYGYAAKGASTVLYRNMDYMRPQLFVSVDWPGGIFVSPSLPGTRPGGAIAAAWAALNAMGEEGYTANAKVVLETADRFTEGINAIDGLAVLGKPLVGVFAYAPTDPTLSCYAIADQLAKCGWHIDRQQRPQCIHLMLNPGHAEIVDEYLEDLRNAVTYVRENPDAAASGSAPAYGLMSNAPMRSLVASNVRSIAEEMYGPRGAVPKLDSEEKGLPPGLPKPVAALWKLKQRFTDRIGRK